MASLIGRVEDLVIENGKVEGKAKTDRMSRGKISASNLSRGLVCLQRLIGRDLTLVALGELGKITMIITLPRLDALESTTFDQHGKEHDEHLMVEHLRLAALSRFDQMLIEDDQDIFANIGELSFNLLAVFLNQADLGLIALGLLFLLDRGDDPPRCTSRTDDVLVSDGEKVTLLDRELLVSGGDLLHTIDHLC